MKVKLREVGNGLVVGIPRPVTRMAGVKEGQEFEVSISRNRIVLTPVKKTEAK